LDGVHFFAVRLVRRRKPASDSVQRAVPLGLMCSIKILNGSPANQFDDEMDLHQ